MPRLVLISDTHGLHDQMARLPEGDILVHAGDLTNSGKLTELREATDWLKLYRGQFKHIIAIAGNHDFACEHFMEDGYEHTLRENFFQDIHYLRDSGVVLEGLNFYGYPWTPEFHNWAFNLPRSGRELKEKADLIPVNTDVLITHGPPMGILDNVYQESVGCNHLRVALEYVRPKLHVFGHIHNAQGFQFHKHTWFYNASICETRQRFNVRARLLEMYNEVANWPLVYDLS